MKKIIVLAAKIVEKIQGCRITLYAADATLFLLVSAVPFAMLLMNTAQFILPYSRTDLMNMSQIFIPTAFIPIINAFIGELYTVPKISAVSVTAIAALWSASKGFAALVKGLDRIYSQRGYFFRRIWAFVYTLIFIISILITLFAIALGNRILELVSGHFPHLQDILFLIDNMRSGLFFLLLTLLFTIGYWVLPKRKGKLIRQLPGAMLASAAWIGFSYAFGIYVDNFSNYSNIYGSLGALVLLVIWMYFCINIFMVGGVVNIVLSEK